MSEINDLIKQKEEIEKKIQMKKTEEKDIKKNNSKSKSSVLGRLSKKFDYELDDIIKERFKIGRDVRVISKSKVTDLIIKHKKWGEVKHGCINFNFKKE